MTALRIAGLRSEGYLSPCTSAATPNVLSAATLKSPHNHSLAVVALKAALNVFSNLPSRDREGAVFNIQT